MEADEYFYWCFVCKKECFVIDTDDGELQCDKCLSTFVEELPYKQVNFTQKINDKNFKKSSLDNKDIPLYNKNDCDLNETYIPNQNQENDTNNEIPELSNNNNINIERNLNPNLIDININLNENNDNNGHLQNLVDDPRNFIPVMSNNNYVQENNNGVTSISFSNQGGNSLIHMQFRGQNNITRNNLNSNNFNTNGIMQIVNSIFPSINNNTSNNRVNITNNSVSLNLSNLFGNYANSLVQGLQSINLNSILGRDFNSNALDNLLNIIMRSDNGNPPASENVIEGLERIEIDNENIDDYNKESCIICADDFLKGNKLICLQCSHFFHDQCIITWLRKRNQCPVCRKELKTDDEEYEKRRFENRTILNNLMRSGNNNSGNNDGDGNFNV